MTIDTLSAGQVISDSARRVSQLSPVYSVLSDDLFLVSRHFPKQVDASILKELENDLSTLIVCLEDGYDAATSATYRYLVNETRRVVDFIKYHFSGAVAYKDIGRQVLSGAHLDFGLGSMAYEEAWDYSKYGHAHDFTRTRLSSAYDTPSCLLQCDIINSAGVVQSERFCVPEVHVPDQKICDIGDIKFLAVDGREVDVRSEGFDGWVFADGARYSKSDFPSAYEVFKAADGSTSDSFVVPALSGFVRPLPGSSATSFHGYNNHVVAHTHADIDNSQFGTYSKSSTVNIMVPIYYSGGGSTSPTAMHTGYSKYYGTMPNLSVEINAKNFRSSPTRTKPIGGDGGEPKPRRNAFSAMVYIGKAGT